MSAYVSILRAFVNWCKKRKFIDCDPLDGICKIDTSVKNPRRAMTPEEIGKVLNAAPSERAIVYKTALISGFRAEELDSLRVGDLDTENCTVFLRAEFAKDRKNITIPIPKELSQELKHRSKGRKQDDQLLPGLLLHHPARYFYIDLEKARVPKKAFGGKLDFHALRTTHVNLGLALGFDAKTVQTLARHKTIDMTMNVYGRASVERMRNAVESLGDCINKSIQDNKRLKNSRTGVVPDKTEKDKKSEPQSDKGLTDDEDGGGGGNRSVLSCFYNYTYTTPLQKLV